MRKTLFLLMFLITPIIILAQGSHMNEYYKMSLEELMNVKVVSASKTEQDIGFAPADMMVITHQQIIERGYKDLKDVFRDLPGFDISENLEGEVRTLVISRGILGNNKILVLRDGEKLNSSSGERFIYGNNVPLYNIERIEIIYGPSSSMYGADAYAGIVNMITKDADKIDGVEVNLNGGVPNTIDGSLLYGKKLNDDISLTLGFRGYFTKGFSLSHFDDYDSLGVNINMPTKDYNLFARANIKDFTIVYSRMDANEPNGYSTNPNAGWYLLEKDFVWHQIIDKISFLHKYETKKFAIISSVEGTNFEVSEESNFNYVWGNQYKYANTFSLKWEERIKLTLPYEIKFSGGFAIEKVQAFPKTSNLSKRFDPDMLVDDMSLWYIDSMVFGMNELYGAPALGVHPFWKLGVYGDFTKQIAEDFQINAGVRFDKPTNYNPTNIYDLINPRFSFIWNPEKTTIKLLYGEAYIQPSEYYKWENFVAGNQLAHIPNPNLEAETMRNYSFVFNQAINKNINIGLSLFRNELEDVIRPRQYTEENAFVDSIMAAGAFVETNENYGKQITQGAEVKVNYSFGNLSGYTYYSFLNAKEENGDPLSKISYHKVHAGLTYTLIGRITISPRLRFIGPANGLTATGVQEGFIDSRTVVDLTLRGKITDNISAEINAVNLFNTKYYAPSPFGEGPSGWIMAKAPQPGLLITGGVSIKF
ncbi:MAG: hypothetical protein C0599_13495 [Salinivirgaceae bacterium]|nr:MAG: hypothetical protein C0599_13495 [Salinivirgaceae bacterium]